MHIQVKHDIQCENMYYSSNVDKLYKMLSLYLMRIISDYLFLINFVL